MRSSLLPALAGFGVLTLAGLAIPGAAHAEVDCKPVIDTASLKLAPTTIKITSTGSATVQLAASFTAPCGDPDAGDLIALVGYGSESGEPFVLDATEMIEPGSAEHSFGFKGTDKIASAYLRNADAGTWFSIFVVADTTPPDDSSNDDTTDDPAFTDVEGPSIRVLRAAKLTADASPEPVRKGKTVTVTGALTRANWDTRKDSAYANQSVQLQFRTKTGSYATVKTVKTSSAGKLSAKVVAAKDGYFRFVFAGTSTTAAVTSAADFIDVK